MKWLVVVALSFGIGFFLGKKSTSVPTQEVTETSTVQSSSELAKTLTPEMIEEYYRLKSMEEKYAKADELLGKIVVAMLKDLGMKISGEAQAQAEVSARGEAANSPNYSPAADQKTTTLTSEIENLQDQKKSGPPTVPDWVKNEARLESLQTDSQALEFLNKVRIDSIDEALRTSQAFKNKTGQFDLIQGLFEGSADVAYSGKRRLWQIEVEINGNMNNGVFKGVSRTKMSENGKIFSNSTDRGEPRNIREFPNSSQALLFRASPKILFQLYHFKSTDSFIGNVYRTDEDDLSYQYVGTMKLLRK